MPWFIKGYSSSLLVTRLGLGPPIAALTLSSLPPIDAVLLSHDHPDNLDPSVCAFLNCRLVFTTLDGARNLAPRPGVKALQPWKILDVKISGVDWKITGTPPEVLGEDKATGKPNAVRVSGDTVYLEEFARMEVEY
ncbi:hypothetical protein EX30DRAFT_398043 [Ascodesmis nigricans]|uniref:Metallo-beta-lactamase domain-containing protein n=1 Tax=Ascodesmis nigricans TaxID=341454 RepID=A0A4S2MMA8_9PEZI|nr:hypothetical protein EX30DRAFT_398043 [Ascodesmis nigricans]